ncbi:MAG: Hsp20/alpha crystallin family protein [Hyphomicrobiales bacterium]|nr:Hsp20/alpha crystallin family protein [Hyphomicrobiales bacterium]
MSNKPLVPVGRDRTGLSAYPLSLLQQEIDRLFDGFARNLSGRVAGALMPSMDMSETDKEIEITAELPGLEEKDVQLNVADNMLTIRGEKKNEREEKDKDYHLLERNYGSFTRTVELPPGVDPDSIKAVIAKGVLKVTVPKPTPSQARKIEVKSAS